MLRGSRILLTLFLMVVVLAAAMPGAEAGELIFKNENGNVAFQNPSTTGPSFTLTKMYTIDTIYTYHWNGGHGAPAGTVSLVNAAGQKYGPWPTQPSSKVYLAAAPNVTLPPGTYTVSDNQPATWSYNSASGGKGFVQVIGTLVDLNKLATFDDVKGRVGSLGAYDRPKAIDTLTDDKKGPVQLAFGLRAPVKLSISKKVISVAKNEYTNIQLTNKTPGLEYYFNWTGLPGGEVTTKGHSTDLVQFTATAIAENYKRYNTTPFSQITCVFSVKAVSIDPKWYNQPGDVLDQVTFTVVP